MNPPALLAESCQLVLLRFHLWGKSLWAERRKEWGKKTKKTDGAAQPAQESELHLKPDLKIPAMAIRLGLTQARCRHLILSLMGELCLLAVKGISEVP